MKCSDISMDYLPAMPRSPQIKMANQISQSRLLNQTFIGAECVRSIRLSTDKSQVVRVYGIACDSCPLALLLIGRTRTLQHLPESGVSVCSARQLLSR